MPTPALSRSMEAEAFITSADADVIARGGLVTELNTWAGQVNTVAGEVNANAGTATTQAGNASTSAANALTSENNAETAETNAATSAANALTSENNAAASESAASVSAAQAAASAAALHGTSTTSLLIAVASKVFTTQADEAYTAGVWITATSAANIANWMYGQVVSYSGTTLTVDVQVIGGSGTYADWNLSISAARGATGATGATGTGITEEAVGWTGTGGTTPKTLTVDDDLTTAQAARRNAANTFTAAQNLARATVASHATTADIWGAAGNQIDWTGTATTTAFPNAPQAGAERVLICAGACSFTAGANMLIDGVASAATVTCAAGDSVIVRAVSTTQFKLTRVKYDGTAQVAASGGDATLNIGYLNIPQNSQSAAYELVLGDSGKHIYHPAADTTARTWTIPANASVAFPIGTAVVFDNDFGAGALTIAITSDTLVLVGTVGSTGSRTLASGGQATAIKVTATRWRITGVGLT